MYNSFTIITRRIYCVKQIHKNLTLNLNKVCHIYFESLCHIKYYHLYSNAFLFFYMDFIPMNQVKKKKKSAYIFISSVAGHRMKEG